MTLTLSFGQAFADDNAMQDLAGLGEDTVIVAAVKAEIAKDKTMDRIEEINRIRTPAGFMWRTPPTTESRCSNRRAENQENKAG